MAFPRIAAFARLAKGGEPPNRAIAGQATKIGRAMHDIQYDPVHDEMVMTNPFAQAILTFRGGADGEEPPIRIIQGPSTQMMDPDHVAVDPVHNELFVIEAEFILVFPLQANGDTAPIRVIRGPDTRLKGGRALAVDLVHNLIVATVDFPESKEHGLVIFNRTDEGNAKPRAVITGPKTGIRSSINQVQVHSPKGWIVADLTGGGGNREEREEGRGAGAIAVWSINDKGDVPPRWLLSGPKSAIQGTRLALNPKAKEVLVGGGNIVQTYSFPEIF